MDNEPQVKIQYLVNYDLSISGTESGFGLDLSDLNPLSDLTDINNQDARLKGKKGLHLNGGSVKEETGEVSGTLLDGTYTFYSGTQSAYKGIMGNELSNDNYEFDNPQYITIRTKNKNTYISSLLIYFDPTTTFIDADGKETTEYATKISFSHAKKYDYVETSVNSETEGIYYIKVGEDFGAVTLPDEYDPLKTYYSFKEVNAFEFSSVKPEINDRNVFLHNFGQDSTLTQIRINIHKWNKKNAFMKILKIVTGYTGIYDKTNLMKFDFTINKTNDANELRFGVTSNSCMVDVLDNNLMIETLYKKDLIYKNIEVQISVDGIAQGIFFINEKNSEKGSNEWIFDCVDKLELIKDIRKPMMPLDNRNIYEIVNYVLSGISLQTVWEKSAKKYCEEFEIEESYFNANQTLYDLLLKCCQVGLLRIYMDRNNICKITRGY